MALYFCPDFEPIASLQPGICPLGTKVWESRTDKNLFVKHTMFYGAVQLPLYNLNRKARK
jgi:hypothetical protein